MVRAGGPLPSGELARLASVSERTLRRAFTELVGVGPRAFGQAVRTGTARDLLRAGNPVTDALLEAGFGSVRAFYETAAETMGMTPSSYAAGAPGERLMWTAVPTPVGTVLGVASARGLCAVRIGPELEPLLDQVPCRVPPGRPGPRRRGARRRRAGPGRARGGAPRAAAPAGRARHGVPGQGLAGADPDPGRRDPDVLAGREGDRRADGGAGRRRRVCPQPARARRAVPSGGACRRRAGRLPVGAGGQAVAARRRARHGRRRAGRDRVRRVTGTASGRAAGAVRVAG